MGGHRVYWYANSLCFSMWMEFAFNNQFTELHVSIGKGCYVACIHTLRYTSYM